MKSRFQLYFLLLILLVCCASTTALGTNIGSRSSIQTDTCPSSDLITQPLVVSEFAYDYEGKTPFERARPTAEGGLVIFTPKQQPRHYCADGTLLSRDSSAGLDVLPSFSTVYDGRYKLSGRNLSFTDVNGDSQLIWKGVNLEASSFSYIGAMPFGGAIVMEAFLPIRFNRTITFILLIVSAEKFKKLRGHFLTEPSLAD